MSDYNEVSKRAYELWEKGGKAAGKDSQYWFQAEKELEEQTAGGQKQTAGGSPQPSRQARLTTG